MVDEPNITAEEFERQYAERSDVTVEWLRENGLVVKRCYCGEEMCEGWAMLSQDFVDLQERLWRKGGRPPDWIAS